MKYRIKLMDGKRKGIALLLNGQLCKGYPWNLLRIELSYSDKMEPDELLRFGLGLGYRLALGYVEATRQMGLVVDEVIVEPEVIEATQDSPWARI